MSAIYEKEVWNQYAMAFLAVMPSKMLELNKNVASIAYGEVCDFGCGAAKIAPFILNNSKVDSYTGIDLSPDMIKLARWHLEQFPEKPSEILQGDLAKISANTLDFKILNSDRGNRNKKGFDFGISINSYYAWSSPEKVLKRIHNILKPNATFVLVTPNHQLDMAALLKEAERELVANPYFESFKDQNMSISKNDKALRIEMDLLVDQVRKSGFKIIETNQHFYDCGLNYLQLTT